MGAHCLREGLGGPAGGLVRVLHSYVVRYWTEAADPSNMHFGS